MPGVRNNIEIEALNNQIPLTDTKPGTQPNQKSFNGSTTEILSRTD